MKRITYLVVVLFAALAIYSGCKKEENDNGAPVTYDSATITGKVQINLNLANDTTPLGAPKTVYEKVPAGTILYAKFNSKDLVTVPSGSATYSDVYLTTTVSSAGTYTIKVPVNKNAVPVSIYSDDISALQNLTDTTNETFTFTLAPVAVTVNPKQVQIVDVTFAKK